MASKSATLPSSAHEKVASPSNLRIIRLPEVMKKTSLGRTTLYRMSKFGDFPESVSLGGKAMGWVEAEIDNWIASRMAARQRTPAASTASR